MTREFIDFVNTHRDEDTARLLLSAARYPSVDMASAVQQIEGLRTAREKWPSLLRCEEFRYPPRLNREQASAEAVAECRVDECLKDLSLDGHFVADPAALCVADLTGGMGVDTMAFARVCREVDYVERDPQLCTLAEENFRVLGLGNVHIHCCDSMKWLLGQKEKGRRFDIIFIDPARRDGLGRKMVGFDSCEPNILQNLPLLYKCCRFLIVKASPMIDIDLGCRQLKKVENVFVLVCRGECKEVAFMCGGLEDETLIHAVVADADNSQYFCITRKEESEAELVLADRVGAYLYEPNAAVMKSGAFAMLCQEFDVEALAPNTHLYTSDSLKDDFPGRIFEVLGEIKLVKPSVAAAVPEGRAHVLTRNYPVRADELQKRLGLKEGGDIYIVATTIGKNKSGFLCSIVSRK